MGPILGLNPCFASERSPVHSRDARSCGRLSDFHPANHLTAYHPSLPVAQITVLLQAHGHTGRGYRQAPLPLI